MRFIFSLLVATLCPLSAWGISPEDIVRKMDANMTFSTRIGESTLTIIRPGRKDDTKRIKSWARGFEDSYSVFLSPARDKGIKYLKLKGNLYMYLPRTEKVMKISGHLLRQSVMDSDFSYEDMLESRALLTNYNVKLLGEETIENEPCWLIEMTAKRAGVTYARRKVWIGKSSHVALRSERFAKSGLLLKVMTSSNIKQFGDRRYPTTMTMQDKLKKGTKTVFTQTNVQFDVNVPSRVFSRRNLMRGN